MPKKSTKKHEEERKGVIPSVQGGIESMKKGVKDLLYGRSAEVSPGKVAEKNRSTGEKIIASLKAVDFYAMKEKKLAEPEQIEEMRISVAALIKKLQNAPTIFDDVSELDNILLNAADTLKTAAEMGYVDQAEWCINAISTGLLLLRDNVPPQRQEAREEIIKKRVEYMHNYENLIIAYGKINGAEQSIASSKKTLADFKNKFEQKKQEIDDRLNQSGYVDMAHLKAHLNQPGSHLNEDDRALELLGREAGDLASSIVRINNTQYAKIMEHASQLTIAMGLRTALDDLPSIYDQDLLGEYAVLLKKINENTNRMLTDAAAVLEIEENAAREMQSIMNGAAARKLTSYSVQAIENVIMPENRVTQRELLEAQLLKSRRERHDQLSMENEEKLRQMMTTLNMETNTDTQENFDFNTAADDNVDVDTNTDTDENTNTDEDTDDNLNYNMLS